MSSKQDEVKYSRKANPLFLRWRMLPDSYKNGLIIVLFICTLFFWAEQKGSLDTDKVQLPSLLRTGVDEVFDETQVPETVPIGEDLLAEESEGLDHDDSIASDEIQSAVDLGSKTPLQDDKPSNEDAEEQLDELASKPKPSQGARLQAFEGFDMENLFENAKELQECGRVKVPEFNRNARNWYALKGYTKLYHARAPFACIPRFRKDLQLSKEFFTNTFRKFAQPVLIDFESLRDIGFTTEARTLDNLSEVFPFDPVKDQAQTYKANVKFNEEFLDLGPAIHALKEDAKLVKQGSKRNFPRNMKIKPVALHKLGVQIPPLIGDSFSSSNNLQSPALWLGSSYSPTAFHMDCCDNLVVEVTGTKRFTLAPPTDWYALSPRCIGKNKNLCYANVEDPSIPGLDNSHFNPMTIDVEAGHVLFMPAGWFHHIHNVGSTLMYNCWTKGSETLGFQKLP